MTLTSAIKAILDTIIIKDEGGWVLTANSNDNDGGWTYAGVTSKVFNNTYKLNQSYSDIEVMISQAEEEQLKSDIYEIYETQYIIPSHVSEVYSSLRRAYLSCCINCGVQNGIKILQTAVNDTGGIKNKLTVDGIWGKETESGVEYFFLPEDVNAFRKAWQAHYIAIACSSADAWADILISEKDLTAAPHLSLDVPAKQWKNLQGWINRAEKAYS